MTKHLSDTILQVENLHLSFGKLKALDAVNLVVHQGEILSIIGPNGAGKTCLLNCISGFYHPQEGEIFFDKKNITKIPSHRKTKLGIGRTFQGIQLFLGVSTLNNIMSGRHIHMKTNFLQGFLYWPWVLQEEVHHRNVAEDIIDFLELEAVRESVVGELGYGLRKRIDLGRALALEPRLLLMDEPMAGMNVEEKEDMARFIIDIQEYRQIPIVLIEHDMEVVMDISNRVVVLEWGHVIAEGKPEEIRKDPRVVKAYLGEE